MQDVEQGEPQSQVLFRVTFLQCITLARQTLHHKSATYQQRHHEAARLPDPPARGPAPGPARPPPGSLRRIRTGEPAATGAGRRGRDRPGGDERHAGRRRSGERNHPRRAPPEPPPGRRRGEWDHVGSVASAGADPAGRPGAVVEAVARCVLRTGSGRTTGGGRIRIQLERHGERHGASVRCRRRGRRRSPRTRSRGRMLRVARGPRGTAPGRLRHAFASAAPFPVCCAPSPSAAPLLLVQWRVKGRSRGKGAQQTRTRTGTRVSPCTGPPPHPPLPPHWLRPSHRGRGRTGERRGPRLGKAADAHLPASAPRPSSSHSSTNPGEKGSRNGIHVRESRS